MRTLSASQQSSGGLLLGPCADQAAVIRQRVSDAAAVSLQEQSVGLSGDHWRADVLGQDTAMRREQKSIADRHGGGVAAVRRDVDPMHCHPYVRPTLSKGISSPSIQKILTIKTR